MAEASKKYIPILDGVRGVSILLVLLSHFGAHRLPLSYLRHLFNLCGSIGVSIFLVLSGYLITTLLLNEEQKVGRINLGYFYIRRTLRIFPAFYVFLLAICLLAWTGIINASPIHAYIASALYIRNIVGRGIETEHLWSLSLEEQFYALWPALLIFTNIGSDTNAKRRIKLVTLILVAICIWRSYLVFTSKVSPYFLYDGKLYMRTDLRIDSILVGGMLAILCQIDWFRRINASRLTLSRLFIPIGLVVVLVVFLLVSQYIPYSSMLESTLTSIVIGLLLNWLLNNEQSLFGVILQKPLMLALGKLSYSLYLWQQLFLAAKSERMGIAQTFPFDIGLTFVAAICSYQYIERPFLRIKDRYFNPFTSPKEEEL